MSTLTALATRHNPLTTPTRRDTLHFRARATAETNPYSLMEYHFDNAADYVDVWSPLAGLFIVKWVDNNPAGQFGAIIWTGLQLGKPIEGVWNTYRYATAEDAYAALHAEYEDRYPGETWTETDGTFSICPF